MSSGIVLSQSVRTNLLALQDTSLLQSVVQNRLATGKKVNSALDNPTNFFTSAGLNRRATDLGSLLDGMSNGIKTIEAADNATKAVTKTIETMQANIRQARQDKSFKSASYAIDAATIGTSSVKNLSFTGGSVGASAVNIALNTAGGGSPATAATRSFTFGSALTFDDAGDQLTFSLAVDGGSASAITIAATDLTAVGDNDAVIDDAAELRAVLTNKLGSGVTVGGTGSAVTITSNTTGAGSAVAITGVTATNGGGADTLTNTSGLSNGSAGGTAAVAAGTVKTVDTLVAEINADAALTGKIRASNDAGKLRIENLSVEPLTLGGIGPDGEVDGTAGTGTLGANEIRRNLLTQFNELRLQLDKLGDDASYNGVNLMRGDKLKVVFNEQGTSRLDIEAKNKTGPSGISTAANSLNISVITAAEYSDDGLLDARLDALKDSMTTLQTHASSLGASLGTVQVRQEFTRSMINTLETGADYLVNADMNEEGANLLSLNTRQQLSQTALSLASQSDQAVLRLFG